MLGIMNLMLLSPAPCYTYLLNETCSAGSWLYLCGVKRFAPKTNLVSYMLHPMEWGSSDSAGNHISHNNYVKKIANHLVELTAARTKISKSKLKALATTETQYFVGGELFTYGIATDVLTTSAFWLSKEKKPATVAKGKKPATQVLIEEKE